MHIKNPPVFYLFLLFFIVNIIDGVTAFFVLPGESNPIYLLTNSILAAFIFKMLWVLFAYYIYHKNLYTGKFIFFTFIMILTIGSIGIGIAAYGNVYAILHPKIIAQSASMSTVEKAQGYAVFTTIMIIIPYVLSIVGFLIYQASLKYASFNKKNHIK